MPPHIHYVEPFAGGLAVLLERDPNDCTLWHGHGSSHAGVSEVANDINGELMNFWGVLRDERAFTHFTRMVEATPLSRGVFEAANLVPANLTPHVLDVPAAVNFFIRARQSRAGTFKGFTSLTRSRTRRGINGNASEWLGAVEGLAAVHARLQPVVLENMDAMKLIVREDAPETLFYLDPPYLQETRTSKDSYGEYEMTVQQHTELLSILVGLKGKWMLSGYPSRLYDSVFKDFPHTLRTFDLPNNAAGGETKRRMTECLWTNY